jgi:hypothetical protein
MYDDNDMPVAAPKFVFLQAQKVNQTAAECAFKNYKFVNKKTQQRSGSLTATALKSDDESLESMITGGIKDAMLYDNANGNAKMEQ